ncbi:hypothetical protein DH2020_026592 [Rehmannia glutinosa]|uniref:J domain-containing protein n=1 Tax=Rehmannia glutinosa TaxID=99300 RepID=A0ABR0VYA2_REHGL
MECNKDEAIRAKEIAEKKMERNDFEAQKGLVGSEKDWYGILQVEKLADELTIKKQYRRLALILHPDKNRFPGAEAAFKLIGEANVLLSDPQRNLYMTLSQHPLSDRKCSGHVAHFAKQDTSTSETMSTNLYAARRAKGFLWLMMLVLKALRGSKLGPQGAQHVPSKPDSSQPAAFHEKMVPNRGNCKMGVKNDQRSTTSHVGSQGVASRKSVQPEPGVRTGVGSEGIKIAGGTKDIGSLKTKETDFQNTNSLHGGKEGGTPNGGATCRKTGDLRNKSRKRTKKESSESCDISSHSDLEDQTMKGILHVLYNETDMDDLASPLKRSQETKDDNEKEQKDALDGEDSKHGHRNSFPTDADYSKSEAKETGTVHSKESLQDKDVESDEECEVRGETGGNSSTGADTFVIESDSDVDTFSSDNLDIDLCHCPDPEFSDFEKARDESQFDVNQFWACYDTLDGMPRFYAKVKKVHSSPFELSITWLEADPIDESYEKWVDEELPVGCGSFKLGKTEKTPVRLSFSHQVHFEKGKKRGSLVIYPREGEVWALFKDWDMSWSSEPENHNEFKYEVVEVLSDFVAGSGIRVVYLDKVTGFVSLFQRACQGKTNSFVIGPNELYKFSHRVPCFKMTGSEREGVPIGSFELDPASLPLNPDDLYYPGKANIEDRKKDPGVTCFPPESDKKKGKSTVSEGMSTPKKFVDLEGTKTDIFELRRSPRGQNVIRQNAI